MTAKHKLNSAYLNGALLFAGVLAAITGSWTVFFVAPIICTTTGETREPGAGPAAGRVPRRAQFSAGREHCGW